MSAQRWVSHLDNQLRVATGWGGLVFFQRRPSSAVWKESNWRRWPALVVSMDLGSDGNSAYHDLERKGGLFIDQIGDLSHAANRDTILALRSSGMFEWYLLMMTSWNLPWGPDRDSLRAHQLQTSMLEFSRRAHRHRRSYFVRSCRSSRSKTKLLASSLQHTRDILSIRCEFRATDVQIYGEIRGSKQFWVWALRQQFLNILAYPGGPGGI